MAEQTLCRGCRAPIQFITTPTGRSMPCGIRRVSVVTADGEVVQGFTPHWAECPAARKFKPRKPRDLKHDDEMDPEDAKAAFRELRLSLGDETVAGEPGADEEL